MSALANILLDEGYQVRGSDCSNFMNSQINLMKRNVIIDPIDAKEFYHADLIIIGHQFYQDELIDELNKHRLVFFEYNEFLSLYLNQNKLISICGSHGKTTLVKMLFDSFDGSSYLCGDGSSCKKENELFFFLESCEYKRHFLKYNPKEIIITNIEIDHTDYYKDENDYISAYQEFIKKADVIYCLENEKEKLTHKKIITCGLNNKAEFYFSYQEKKDYLVIDFYHNDQFIESFNYPIVPNKFLELLCLNLTFYYCHNFDIKMIVNNIKNFKMPHQRFNETSYLNSVIIEDYCHHPSQIEYNLEKLNLYYHNYKKVGIFRPDRTSRLIYFKEKFKEILSHYDYAFVLPLSNTEELNGHSSKELVNQKIIYVDKIEKIWNYLENKKDNYVFSLMSSKDLKKEVEALKNQINVNNLNK